jgi:hypothetical protein
MVFHEHERCAKQLTSSEFTQGSRRQQNLQNPKENADGKIASEVRTVRSVVFEEARSKKVQQMRTSLPLCRAGEAVPGRVIKKAEHVAN